MIKNLLIATFALTFLLISCGDDDDGGSGPSQASDNLLPNANGSFWLGNYYAYDEDGNLDPESEESDSTAVTGAKTVAGVAGTEFTSYRDGKEFAKLYARSEADLVYVTSSFLEALVEFEQLPVDLPIVINDQWFKVADTQNDKWQIFSQTIEDFEIDIQGFKLSVNATLVIKGSYRGIESFDIDAETKNAHVFEIEITTEEGEVYLQGNKIDNFQISRKIELWFVNDIGLVKQILHNSSFEFPYLPEEILPGYELTVYDYYIAE